MTTRLRQHDRRAPDRPANGDTAPCPQCGHGTLEFNERYRVSLASGEVVLVPAWLCDRSECRYGRPVRREQQRLRLHTTWVNLRAHASRRVVKPRADARKKTKQ